MGNTFKPVVEVHPELAGLNRLGQIPIGGGDDTDIGSDGLVAAQAFELFQLQHAQEFDLQLHGHLADLVQKKR